MYAEFSNFGTWELVNSFHKPKNTTAVPKARNIQRSMTEESWATDWWTVNADLFKQRIKKICPPNNSSMAPSPTNQKERKKYWQGGGTSFCVISWWSNIISTNIENRSKVYQISKVLKTLVSLIVKFWWHERTLYLDAKIFKIQSPDDDKPDPCFRRTLKALKINPRGVQKESVEKLSKNKA